jgi:hypothetical protein
MHHASVLASHVPTCWNKHLEDDATIKFCMVSVRSKEKSGKTQKNMCSKWSFGRGRKEALHIFDMFPSKKEKSQ